jgi:hypothetical protein
MVRRATHRRPRTLRRRSPRGTAAPARIRPPLAGRRTSPAASASRDGLLASAVPTKAASANSRQATRMRALRDVYHNYPAVGKGTRRGPARGYSAGRAPMAARLRGRYFYGWLIVGVTFLTLLAASGGRAVPSVLILPLEHDFGWSRAVVALAISINLLLFGLCGPFAAAVMERIGMRALMLVALLVMGLGAGALSGWVAATVANRWFGARRGLGDRGGGLAAGRAAGGGAGAGPPAPGRLRHPRLPAAHWAPALRGTATRGRDDATARRGGQPLRCRAPYAAGGGLLHLRGEHQRADWHAPDPVLGRARHDRGGGGESACDDRGLRYCRHDRLGLALGSV